MTITLTTSNFVSVKRAIEYYLKNKIHGLDTTISPFFNHPESAFLAKVRSDREKGIIAIGRPKIKFGEKCSIDDDGRYVVSVPTEPLSSYIPETQRSKRN
jgi:hypothetical protein